MAPGLVSAAVVLASRSLGTAGLCRCLLGASSAGPHRLCAACASCAGAGASCSRARPSAVRMLSAVPRGEDLCPQTSHRCARQKENAAVHGANYELKRVAHGQIG
jgi:hypothetical protein